MPHYAWKHFCAVIGAEVARGTRICPDCSRPGRSAGWAYSRYEANCAYQARTELKAAGPHRPLADRLLEPLFEICRGCGGTGLLDVDEGADYRLCPNCHGTGRVAVASDDRMAAVRQQILDQFPDAGVTTSKQGAKSQR